MNVTPTRSLSRWPITEVFLAGHEFGRPSFCGAASSAATAVAHGFTVFAGHNWREWAQKYWTDHVLPVLLRKV